MAQAELDGVRAGEGRQLVHERLVGEGVLHPARRTDPRRPERRRLESMADGVDVRERVGRRRVLEDVPGVDRVLLRQGGEGGGDEGDAVGDGGEPRDPELGPPGDDLARGVETSLHVHEGGRTLGVPAVLVRARPLDANGLPIAYIRGPRYGQAVNDNQFPQPIPRQNGGRLFRMAFGLMF